MSVVVVGSLNVDLNVTVDRLPGPGETLLGAGGRTSPGGKGANQALAAALRGAEVRMVGAVGEDANAAVALSRLSQAGVDTSLVAGLDAPTGLAVCVVDGAGRNTIVVVPGANGLVGAAQVEAAAPAITRASVLVLQGEVPPGAVAAAVRAACGHAGGAGVPGRPRILLNLAPVIPLDARIVQLADPLVVNEHEGRLVLKEVFGIDPASLEKQADPDVAVARALVTQGLASVVMTLGSGVRSRWRREIPVGRWPSPHPSGGGGHGGRWGRLRGALAASLAAGGTLAQAVGPGCGWEPTPVPAAAPRTPTRAGGRAAAVAGCGIPTPLVPVRYVRLTSSLHPPYLLLAPGRA
ncbi:PfkB family carbohydrate kinase [Actinomyces lilanjuaniae]|uniref:PfkB family carbohydrate kinase n=1 Tax=Actinomyces lilanjuaniae TaxID=2321394 RepID=UPI001968D991|nr:PfkB family carbohydrate kinase [Actinomyces lilanjuaniae]